MMAQQPTPDPARRRGPLRRGASFGVSAVLAVFILLDEAARPLYRPLLARIAALRLMAALEAQVARLPRTAILVALAVPFAVAEPLKVVGVILIGRGAVVSGILILALAYLASFVLVERVYHAGREKLLTIGWFAAVMVRLAAVRAAALAMARRVLPLETIRRTKAAVRGWLGLAA